MLFDLLLHLILTSLLILFIAQQVKGIQVNSWWTAICGATVLGLINTILFPVVSFLLLPFTIITLGLFLLIIHAMLFYLSASLVAGFQVNGFVPALYGSILLTLFNLVLSIFI